MIPGPNKTQADLGLSRRHTNLAGIEIMPYHNMGVDKSRRIGREFLHINLKTIERTAGQKWVDRLMTLGCTAVRLG